MLFQIFTFLIYQKKFYYIIIKVLIKMLTKLGYIKFEVLPTNVLNGLNSIIKMYLYS